MKRTATLVTVLVVNLLVVSAWSAEGGGERPREPRLGEGSGIPGDFERPAPPLFEALDTDKDGRLSSAEIDAASGALKKLDSDGDGAIDREELRAAAPRRGARDERDREPRRRQRPGAERAGFAERITQRLLERDEDGDGKLSADELPGRMQDRMEFIDKNSDGFIEEKELKAMVERAGSGRGRKDRRKSDTRSRAPEAESEGDN